MINVKEASAPSEWQTFIKSVPWLDMLLGLAVPKAIFYVSMNRPWLLGGVAAAIGWCLGLFAVQYFTGRRSNFWAVLGLFMILMQLVPVLLKNDQNLNFIAGSFSSLLIGCAFLFSILANKPVMRLLAEAAGARNYIPEKVLESPYYHRAWLIVTAAWSSVYLVEAAILLYLALNRSGALVSFDIFCSWPTTIIMIFFTVKFPRLYWRAVIKDL